VILLDDIDTWLAGLFVVERMILFQTLLSELQSPSIADDSFLDVIMSCCHILVTSCTFGLGLTTKFDHMVCLSLLFISSIRPVVTLFEHIRQLDLT